jgi:hypothetical protein
MQVNSLLRHGLGAHGVKILVKAFNLHLKVNITYINLFVAPAGRQYQTDKKN